MHLHIRLQEYVTNASIGTIQLNMKVLAGSGPSCLLTLPVARRRLQANSFRHEEHGSDGLRQQKPARHVQVMAGAVHMWDTLLSHRVSGRRRLRTASSGGATSSFVSLRFMHGL